ncbi:DUF6885 family protein [Nocardioides acrostichi]|uniref:Uncharacterized protein n=1 Tax=Nocardioides acrostichi TaxID=2784339 RepID=A0A930Y6J7_9ACTN|nr:hypothetical protein [Nocardioides acrostichi]MBF4161062.1 hypothetical protein [Nocardioides acrostichi]
MSAGASRLPLGGGRRVLPGGERVVAGRVLPQPDQLCGPFAASHALRAVLTDPPTVVDLARAAGTRIWPHDVAAWRPAGAPWLRTHWEQLPRAAALEASGTDAAGLARGITEVCGDRVELVALPMAGVEGVTRRLDGLLDGIVETGVPVGVLANLRTGPLGEAFDVGHFVGLWCTDGAGPTLRVGVADSYVELGAPGEPAGCRLVPLDALATALTAPPGRGLMLLVTRENAEAIREIVTSVGLPTGLWSA